MNTLILFAAEMAARPIAALAWSLDMLSREVSGGQMLDAMAGRIAQVLSMPRDAGNDSPGRKEP